KKADKQAEKKDESKSGSGQEKPADKGTSNDDADLSPAVRRFADEEGIDVSRVEGTGRNGQVTKEDLVKFKKSGSSQSKSAPAPAPAPAAAGSRPEERVPMTRIRKRIAERLMQSKDSIAMLTSFNEVNLAKVKQMRKDFGEQFKATHDIKLGYMSFFVKAVCEALKRHPV